jgi:hypothetical protein
MTSGLEVVRTYRCGNSKSRGYGCSLPVQNFLNFTTNMFGYNLILISLLQVRILLQLLYANERFDVCFKAKKLPVFKTIQVSISVKKNRVEKWVSKFICRLVKKPHKKDSKPTAKLKFLFLLKLIQIFIQS